ncbi:hypothetical protein QWJ34_22645 [Saccharibacillus sp. CPCC 101409]|uniref:hypothetical protein n=1 Tax=Saccharibacillus sp. CPCC 101409 TaxID=3058041 RepID=UPI002673B34E|nr:hypothetical protein [Saccharibacillus sp. CPCC 101409]MDO3412582.1 hypothetical protein [Saccharibacillus sp. CPCC 101409]
MKLRCNCDDWKVLHFERYVYEQDEIIIAFDSLPLLICPTCGNIDLPDHTSKQIQKFITDNKESGRKVFQLKGHSDEPFEKLQYPKGCVDFKISKSDCFFIPALNLGKLGEFSPVFFSLDVLINYIHNPRYTVHLGSETYGQITSEEFGISFGINRNNKVIMWLIDIVNLPEEEQYYLRAKNIPSDHDVGSEFYEGQFEAVWTGPSKINHVKSLRKILSQLILQEYGLNLFMLDEEAEVIAKRISKPILFTDKEIGDTYEDINKIFVESLNVKEIKAFIVQNSNLEKKDLAELRGMKILRCWLIQFLNLTEETVDQLLLPLFVLYDLRIVYAHLTSTESREEKLISVCKRIGLNENCRDNEVIYNVVIDKIISMYETIIGHLD